MNYDDFNEACITMIEEEKRRFKVVPLTTDISFRHNMTKDEAAQVPDDESVKKGEDEFVLEEDDSTFYDYADIMMVPLWEGDLFGQGITYSTQKLYQVSQSCGMEYVRSLLREQIRLLADGYRRSTSRNYRNLLDKEDQALYDRMRKVRSRMAQVSDTAPYIILSNRGLYELCKAKPETLHDLADVYGFGQINIKKYGQAFLDEMTAFLKERKKSENADNVSENENNWPSDSYENGWSSDSYENNWPSDSHEADHADCVKYSMGSDPTGVSEASRSYHKAGKIIPFRAE